MPRGFSRPPRLQGGLRPPGGDQRPFISSDQREDQEPRPRASQEDPERRRERRERRKEQRR